MTIRKLHSNNIDGDRTTIAKEYTELYFDDATNSILLPDPTGLLELKFPNAAPTTTTTAPAVGGPPVVGSAPNPTAVSAPAPTTTTGIKGFASGYVNAGVFLTLDNLKFSVTTSGARGLCCATVSGSVTLSISANYALAGGANGTATYWPGAAMTTTPSGSWFGWSFPNAGDGSTYLCNDYTNQKVYRVTLQIGPGYSNNFISIERLL